MKYPKEVNAYCPYCKLHTPHKAKGWSKGRARAMAVGTRSHERQLTGHGSKRAGVKSVKKQGKRQVVMLACTKCSKKHPRTIGVRTTKKIEFKQ